ncbi:hypothetical protein GOP47_0007466 [Adiantum capillus-veneris]|uniref:Uncharacterized protein n=1 Tax=Adiantum capillus-veneris TaxID=13818 RepID=A0A9D4V1K6_ADICA|nr:hypothetical protein GOP47_0007466 [Adiantum capillus-veneris]
MVATSPSLHRRRQLFSCVDGFVVIARLREGGRDHAILKRMVRGDSLYKALISSAKAEPRRPRGRRAEVLHVRTGKMKQQHFHRQLGDLLIFFKELENLAMKSVMRRGEEDGAGDRTRAIKASELGATIGVSTRQ